MVFDVLPQLYAKQIGVHAPLHQQSFMDAQMSGRGGRLVNAIDEMCNSPQKYSVDLVTILGKRLWFAEFKAHTTQQLQTARRGISKGEFG